MSTISALTRPPGAPGQRITKGTRTPPSQVVPLSPLKRRGAAFRPHVLIGAVVGRIDDDRILIEPGLGKLVEKLTDVAVMFLQPLP